MMWLSWPSQDAFDSWHQQVVIALGLPRVGVNAKTGHEQPDKQKTTAYTEVREVGPGDWRAPVETHIAARFTNGIGTLSSQPEVGWQVVDGTIIPPAAPDVEDSSEFTGDLL